MGICATKVGHLHPFTCHQSGDSSVPSHFSTHLGGEGSEGMVGGLKC